MLELMDFFEDVVDIPSRHPLDTREMLFRSLKDPFKLVDDVTFSLPFAALAFRLKQKQ